MSENVLFAFDSAGSAEPWTAVNDTVMGGVSKGTCRVTDSGTLEFSGEVSLENNGGFASVRVGVDSLDLSAYDTMLMRVRGDGKRYALSVQTDYRIIAGAYYFDFQPEAGRWLEIRVPLQALTARSFGRPLPTAPELNSSDIRAFGFIISDKQAGPFRLEVDWIKAYRTNESEGRHQPPATRAKAKTAARLIQEAIGRGVPLFNAGQPASCAAVYEMTARCIVELSAPDLPSQVVATLRAGLAKAETTTDPAARAWLLRDALDVAIQALQQDDRATKLPDE
ncbi:MAG TPA: CIA30 family protein [Phycisphaerae bacterium]|nr:CIA30 family protein [Phycisphaerae bacterium]HNU44865.1 CIA30 family protein [Phycisphaerae bacterium]